MQTFFGIGNDLIAVSRIRDVMRRHGERFLQKILSQAEILYCVAKHELDHPEVARHVAGRFAAKEAIVKALGTGFQEGITWQDIIICPNSKGKPEVQFSPAIFSLFGPLICHVSISHCHEYAMATAVILTPTEP